MARLRELLGELEEALFELGVNTSPNVEQILERAKDEAERAHSGARRDKLRAELGVPRAARSIRDGFER